MITLLTMNYRKVNNNIVKSLSLTEVNTYIELLRATDYKTDQSCINQDELAERAGISISTVQRHLYKMTKLHLITTETTNGKSGTMMFKFNKYQILYDISEHDEPEHWVYIDVGLLNKEPISYELKGFLVKLKICCFNYTNDCKYSVRELASEMGLGKSSVDKYLKLAESLGYIKWKRGESIKMLRKDIFINGRETDFASIRGFHEIMLDELNFDEKGHFLRL